ncbi:MAG: thioredoxin family protein [Desulfobacteraceae bacterium]|nr:thioredoxin family protein [Desulfobacteraceae bacterium]
MTGDVRIDLLPAGGEEPLVEMTAFTEALAALTPGLKIRRDDEADAARPGLRLAPNLVFHAAPRGTELPVFLETAALVAAKAAPALSEDQRRVIEGIDVPAQLELYVSPHCPFCPLMTRRLVTLALASGQLMVAVIDAGTFPAEAQAREIRSVPTLVLDDGLRWTGEASLDEILPALGARDPARLGAAVFQRMLESGAAFDLAAMMARAGRIFPAFVDLLMHVRWSVRLGAMVAAETLADEAPTVAAALAPGLMARYGAQGVAVRGDLLQVLGMVGGPELADAVEAMTREETHADVCEAAAEAVASLRQKSAARE